jgi:hypothetical protein
MIFHPEDKEISARMSNFDCLLLIMPLQLSAQGLILTKENHAGYK